MMMNGYKIVKTTLPWCKRRPLFIYAWFPIL